MSFKFEKLRVWPFPMDMGEDIDSIAENFPKKEQYNLTSQMRRAADSIALNISEGSIGQSNPENRKFVGYSIRSLAEQVTCPHKAKRRKYIKSEEFEKIYDKCYNLMDMLIAYKSSINQQVIRTN